MVYGQSQLLRGFFQAIGNGHPFEIARFPNLFDVCNQVVPIGQQACSDRSIEKREHAQQLKAVTSARQGRDANPPEEIARKRVMLFDQRR